MKKKIILLIIFTMIFNTVFIYGDNDINSSSVVNNYEEILGEGVSYDPNSDIYYIPSSKFNGYNENLGRSGAVAVSGSAISAILALGVKAGLEFTNSNSMGEFLNRFFMVDGITSVLSGIEDVVSNSVGGVLNFSRSLLDSVFNKFSEVMSVKSLSSVYYKGYKFPVITDTNSSTLRAMAMSTSLPLIPMTTKDYGKYIESEIPSIDEGKKLVYYMNDLPYFYLKYKNSDGTYSNINTTLDSYIRVSSSSWMKSTYKYYFIPHFLVYESGAIYLNFSVARFDSQGLYSSSVVAYGSKLVDGSISSLDNKNTLPTIGSAWSDTILGNDGSSSSDLDIKIPSDTNSLIGLDSDSVTSTPSYEVWNPGTVIGLPSIDTGSDDVTDTPSYEVINPPSADTDTPSTAWDWLKALLQSILDLIRSISDWLTNFWDKLLEFIISIFVPSDSYFTDKFSDIMISLEQKLPNIDISKLNDLAVGEYKFEDIYATFFGIECLVVRGSIINNIVGWAKPIIQGLIGLFLLLYNYSQVYKLIRGGSLVGSSNVVGNMINGRIGGKN